MINRNEEHRENYIGDYCVDSNECVTVNSECRTGICQCIPGYSFSPKTHECKGENYIGDSCVDSNECVTVNSECRTGICQCIPGYSFSPKTHECKECTNYGNDYWEIMDHYISKKNLETLDGVTLQECFNLCNSRTECTCVSLEYGRATQVCYLANITVLHYPERWYHDSVQTFEIAYYQRDCE
ncbi:fibrillin-2-like [Ruditapes philippinarum]|uniref:fibrillin-2-like n=1 Tax=Ruditapes philippinarum TaxID=129788 RepID=UPI00295A7DBF|nr:fibrillin-2-like [Ruditapes philippinarum]